MEKIKVGLLAVIAITLSVNTYILATKEASKVIQDPIANLSNISSATPVPQGVNNPTSGAQAQVLDANNLNMLNNPAEAAVNVDPNRPTTSIRFEKEVHDFGKIKQNSENTFIYKFKNTGTNPLVIESATGSCGCTVPNYPKEPIMPGKTGDIEVVYRPGTQEAAQEKTVTVVANTNPKSTIIKLKAFVEKE
ncbi:MAG: DUF1573 domain-containing protein [Flavobacteriales bacterium]